MTATKGHAEIIGWPLIAFVLNRRDSIGDSAFRNDAMVVGASVKIPLRRQCNKTASFPKPRPVHPAKLINEKKYNADLKY